MSPGVAVTAFLAGWLAGFLAFARFVFIRLDRIHNGKDSDTDAVHALMFGAFWPLTLPLTLAYRFVARETPRQRAARQEAP